MKRLQERKWTMKKNDTDCFGWDPYADKCNVLNPIGYKWVLNRGGCGMRCPFYKQQRQDLRLGRKIIPIKAKI